MSSSKPITGGSVAALALSVPPANVITVRDCHPPVIGFWTQAETSAGASVMAAGFSVDNLLVSVG